MITNLFSKYGLTIIYVPTTKKNQGRLGKQLENEEDISSSLHPVFLWRPMQLPLSQTSPQFIVPCHFFFLSSVLPRFQGQTMQPTIPSLGSLVSFIFHHSNQCYSVNIMSHYLLNTDSFRQLSNITTISSVSTTYST